MAGHVSPEAALGGPIAALRDGDTIVFDIPRRELRVELTDQELAARMKDWKTPAPNSPRGVFRKYAETVSSASRGAVTNY
jgi:dihydroxy-acid dehydratase